MDELIAIWDRTAQTWRLPIPELFGPSASYSETWPTSGSMRGGCAYALPMPVLPTDVPECSSSLPTPRATRGGSATETVYLLDSDGVMRGPLLPTPTASEAIGAGYTDRVNGGGHNLRTEVSLLPTPTTQDAANTAGPSQLDRKSLPLNAVVTLLPTPLCSDGGGPRGSSAGWGLRDESRRIARDVAALAGGSTPLPFTDGN